MKANNQVFEEWLQERFIEEVKVHSNNSRSVHCVPHIELIK